jgi:hypothetical protein
MQPDMQANASLQAMGLRVIRTFCPLKRVLYEVLGKFSAGGNSLYHSPFFKRYWMQIGVAWGSMIELS